MGISQKQAQNFSKWRSDRVFERILIIKKIIKEDPDQNRDHYFTIEKFYAGEYQHVKPDSNARFYPCYRLPSEKEWRLGVHFEDSIEHVHKTKTGRENTDVTPCSGKKWLTITKPYQEQDEIIDVRYPIIDLRGNVAEWTDELEVSIGGGWADKAQKLMSQDTFHLSNVNAWTGFRNVCEWKEFQIK